MRLYKKITPLFKTVSTSMRASSPLCGKLWVRALHYISLVLGCFTTSTFRHPLRPSSLLILITVSLTAFEAPPVAAAPCSKPLTISFFDIEAEYDENGRLLKPSHVDILIMQEILALTGCTYQFKKLPWARIPYSIKHGESDVTFATSYSKEREEIGYFTVPYRQEKMGMVMRRIDIPTTHINTFNDLISTNQTIGIRLGIWYGPEFQKAFQENAAFKTKILRAAGHSGLLDWLLLDRVDILFSEVRSARNEIRQMGLQEKLGLHPFIVHRGNIHIMLSRATTNSNDVAIFNRAITAFKQTDRYQTLQQIFETE